MHSYFDYMILLLISFGIGALFAHTWQPNSNDQQTLIVQSSSNIQTFESNQNGIHVIESKLGNSMIEIKGHSARFISSDCTHKICIQNGWLNPLHPIIACIPNAVSIQLTGSQPNKALVDAYSF